MISKYNVSIKRTRLFHFTEKEERMMERAKRLSAKFMEHYGQRTNPDNYKTKHNDTDGKREKQTCSQDDDIKCQTE